MLNSQWLFNDGLTSACVNNNSTTWTYNQGVILGGLVNLYEITVCVHPRLWWISIMLYRATAR